MNIVITGDSSGIGKMLRDRLESQGHIVYGLSRRSTMHCDVSKWEDVEAWSRYLLDSEVYVDALITCAGTQGEMGKIINTNPEKWSETVRVNLDGTYNAIRGIYPLMQGARRPKIVCFAGGGAANGRPYFSAYASAKTAVVRLVETVAMEESGSLDINAVAPGAIKTDIINGPIAAGPEKIGEAEYQKAVKQSEGGDSPTPMFELVDWLLSSKSDGITGNYISAKWDSWEYIPSGNTTDLYKLRRNAIQ